MRPLFSNRERLLDLFRSENRWVKIPIKRGKCIIVSDLHNDGRALRFIVHRYLRINSDDIVVICGDYIDRAPLSWMARPKATINVLLQLKLTFPDRLFMLMGNHELNPEKYIRFTPSEFWESLSGEEIEFYSDVLETLPFIATTENGVICIHGVLPPDKSVFSRFEFNVESIRDCLWADYHESDQPDYLRGVRARRFRSDFDRSMNSFKKNILIKGHNPKAPLKMFDDRCVTIQTTRSFEPLCQPHIAIIDLIKPVNDANDIELVNLSSTLSG